jgi:hypothetical protein
MGSYFTRRTAKPVNLVVIVTIIIIIDDPDGAADPYRTSSWASRPRPIPLQVRRAYSEGRPCATIPIATTTTTTVPARRQGRTIPRSQISRRNQQQSSFSTRHDRNACQDHGFLICKKYVLGNEHSNRPSFHRRTISPGPRHRSQRNSKTILRFNIRFGDLERTNQPHPDDDRNQGRRRRRVP